MLSATNHKLSMALEVANIVPWKWNLKDHTILCDLYECSSFYQSDLYGR